MIFENLKKKVYEILGNGIKKMNQKKSDNGFSLYSYKNSDGTFDYEKYRKIQIAGNKKKIKVVWAAEENILFLSNYLNKNIANVEFGLCHGTRRGKEQEWFRKYLKSDVIGTEISDTAFQFPHTIQWDFHDVKPEWINNVDFIYSNSFDHSYDPQKCLNAWMSCIKKGGMCIIEQSSDDEKSSKLDPFGVSISELPYFILTWGKGKYCVTEMLTAPLKFESEKYPLLYLQYLIIKKI